MEGNQKDTRKNIAFKTLSERSLPFVSDSRTDRVLYAVAHKLEKVVAATILVTEGVLPDPLAAGLREVSVSAHAAAYQALAPVVSGGDSDTVRPLVLDVDRYLSLLRAAAISGILSPMNADLLDREVGKIFDTLNSIRMSVSQPGSARSGTRVISSELLASPSFDTQRLGGFSDSIHSPLTASAFSAPALVRTGEAITQKDIKDIKDNQGKKEHNQKDIKKTKVQTKKTFIRTVSSSDRRDEIIRILQAHGPSEIVHISRLIPEYSTKTILREVNSLIDEGKVARHGNKRWSLYSVV